MSLFLNHYAVILIFLGHSNFYHLGRSCHCDLPGFLFIISSKFFFYQFIHFIVTFLIIFHLFLLFFDILSYFITALLTHTNLFGSISVVNFNDLSHFVSLLEVFCLLLTHTNFFYLLLGFILIYSYIIVTVYSMFI